MRGFLMGSLALIVLYTVIDTADNAGAALEGSAEAFRRFLSPTVAAVPDFTARKVTAAASKPGPGPSATVNPTVAPFTVAGLAPTRTPAGASS